MELYHAFQQSATKFADRIAFEYESNKIAYGDLLAKANIAGHEIQRLFPERQNIALLIPNTIFFPISLFGTLAAGHIAVPFSPLLNPEELAQLIRHSDTKTLIYDELMKDKAEKAVEMAGVDILLIPAASLLEGESANAGALDPAVDIDAESMILYTSGTTGDPKGVVLSHRNIYSNYVSFTRVLNFNEHDTFLCCLPLHHTYAMTVIVFGALLRGARVILYLQFAPQKIVEAMLTEPNVVIAAVPPMLLMAARFAPDDAALRHRLRYVVSGGGPLPVEVYHFFYKKFNHEILEGYGLTETSPVVAYNPPGKNKVGTIGPPLPDVEVQVRDEEGRVLGPNQIGELCVRGELVMKGYYKNEDATRAVFYEEGWLRTGDMASIDEQGYIKIVGRLKDIIVSAGENIYPREIEETLQKYPGVVEAAVVAKPDRLRTEIPYAYVVLSEAAKGKVSGSDLREFCRQHLAEYKAPDDFEFIDVMPRTAKGTIEKKELRRRLSS